MMAVRRVARRLGLRSSALGAADLHAKTRTGTGRRGKPRRLLRVRDGDEEQGTSPSRLIASASWRVARDPFTFRKNFLHLFLRSACVLIAIEGKTCRWVIILLPDNKAVPTFEKGLYFVVHLRHRALRFSLSPEILKSIRRQLRIANRVLDILVAEIGLQGAGVVALVGQRKATGVP
jgi:hypothetical protein